MLIVCMLFAVIGVMTVCTAWMTAGAIFRLTDPTSFRLLFAPGWQRRIWEKITYSRTEGIGASAFKNQENPIIKKINRMVRNSGIQVKIPWVGGKQVTAACTACGLLTGILIYADMNILVPALVLGLLGAGIPLMLLDVMARYQEDLIQTSLSDFISVLVRWCGIREDILYALEKSVDSGIGEPVRRYVREACIRIRNGLPEDEALQLLQDRVENPLFQDLVINIRQTVKSRGDIKGLLQRMET